MSAIRKALEARKLMTAEQRRMADKASPIRRKLQERRAARKPEETKIVRLIIAGAVSLLGALFSVFFFSLFYLA